MNQTANSAVSSHQLLAIDEICERFEVALRDGQAPRLEEYLNEAGGDLEQEQLFAHLLSVEIDYRLGGGEVVGPQDYLARFPGQATAIHQILPQQRRADGPTEIGQYRIISKLGSGGMGAVYKAFQPRLNRFVAIKMLPAGLLDNDIARQRFDRELKAAGKVLHPNIVTAFDAGQTGNTDYLVMELVEGFDLAQLERCVNPLPIAAVCELIRQASLGLAQVHQLGLVHRDIKPANLMLGPNGQVKILDLGLALLQQSMATESGAELTNTNQMMGTFDYMAPEQCVDSHAVDQRADVYALGATLFRLLTGSAPFAHRRSLTQVGRLSAKLLENPPSPSELRNDVPAALATLVERMLAREPEQRVASAAEVARLLAPFCRSADLEKLFAAAGESQATASLSKTATLGPTVLAPIVLAPNEPISDNGQQAETRAHPRVGFSAVWPRLALLLAATAAAILAGVFFLQTKHGTLRVEINDPQITAQISGEKVILRQGDRDKEITLSPGERKLLIERDGFRFETNQIEIRNGQQVSLRVELLDGEITVRKDDKVIGSKTLPTPPSLPQQAAIPADPQPEPPPAQPPRLPGPTASEGEIAKYLATLDAQVGTVTLDPAKPDEVKITSLRWADAHSNPSVEALQPCARLRHLESLGYHGGNEGFKLFLGCTEIKALEMGPAQMDAEGAKLIARLPKIERIQVPCGDCRAFMAELTKIPTIKHIHLYRCQVNNDDVEVLIDMPQLREFWISSPGTTPLNSDVIKHLKKMKQLTKLTIDWAGGPSEAEVKELRAALPNCAVNE